MENRAHHAASEVERIKDDLTKLRADFGDLFGAALELGKNAPGEMKDKLEDGIVQLKKLAKQAKVKGGEAVETFQEKVAERPLTSIAISLGVGVLVGALLSRR